MKIKYSERFSTAKMLWVVYFCYATFVALIFQKFLLPMLPSLHAGSGLLAYDSIYFHNVAIDQAKNIIENGWSVWTFWPGHGCGLNVAVLSALYVLFGEDPSLVIPVNAVLHASSGVLIYLIGLRILPGRIGHYAGIVASILFVMLPSSLNWYAQIHKDGYAILGLLVILYFWLSWNKTSDKTRFNIYIFLIGNILGGLLLMSVRPYALDILMLVVLLFLCIVVVNVVFSKLNKSFILGPLLAVFCLGLLTLITHKLDLGFDDEVYLSVNTNSICNDRSMGNYAGKWDSTSLVPAKLEHYARAMSAVRYIAICDSKGSGSLVDEYVAPDNFVDMLAYFPRALQISLFAPFPQDWFQGITATRLVGWIEIMIWYVLFPGIIFLLWRNVSVPILMVLSFCLVFLSIYGYVTANLGTLHRVRYPFVILLMLLGLLGWCKVLFKLFKFRSPAVALSTSSLKYDLSQDQVKTINAGISVVVITSLSFLLLFFRDVLMGQKYGVGNELDSFYLAMLLPMFIVNVLCLPIGSAIIPAYHKLMRRSKDEADTLVSGMFFYAFTAFMILGAAVLFFARPIFSFIANDLEMMVLDKAVAILPYGVAILILSIVIVLANTVLNARKIFAWPAIFQIAVPVCAILLLVKYGSSLGVISVAIGMLIGQIVNLLLVLYLVYRSGFRLKLNLVAFMREKKINDSWQLYFALAIAALFTNAVIVIDNIMASSIGAGSIGIYSLGSKVNIFITGVIGMGLTSVILPRFSALVSTGDLEKGKNDLTLFLYFGTALAILVGLVLFCYCDDVVRILFSSQAMTQEGVFEVGRVAIFGVIHLPFFISYSLLIKFSNANGKGKLVVFTAAIGLILNIIFNIILIRIIGVAGLALSTTLAMLATSLIFLVMFVYYKHLKIFDALLIILLWGLYLTTLICLYYESYAGVIISIATMLFLLWEQLLHYRNSRYISASGVRLGASD